MVFFDWLARLFLLLASIALAILVALMVYQVWGRYVLNDTPTWAENLALLLVLVVVLPVAAVGLRENFHLGISFIKELLPPRMQLFTDLFITILLAVFGFLMAFFSFDLVTGTWERNIPLLGIPQGVRYLPLVFCGSLIVIFMIERTINLLNDIFGNKDL
jgi:TRAP-type C4-dicarboxylate transport system permease small subunit